MKNTEPAIGEAIKQNIVSKVSVENQQQESDGLTYNHIGSITMLGGISFMMSYVAGYLSCQAVNDEQDIFPSVAIGLMGIVAIGAAVWQAYECGQDSVEL
jgi:hypothetical protein